MRQIFFICQFIFTSTVLIAQSGQISGFSDAGAIEELKKEKTFDDLISAEHIGETIRDLSSRPHNLGSPGSKEVAEKIQQKFRNYGFTVRMDVYQVLFPEPKIRILEMTAPAVLPRIIKRTRLERRCNQWSGRSAADL